MKKLYIWGWHSDSEIEALKKLEDDRDILIIKWFSNANNTAYHLNDFIHKPQDIKTKHCDISDEEYQFISKNYMRFADMYTRVTYSKAKPYQEFINIFNIYIRYFYADMLKYKPDVVMFSTFPHFGADYVLYLCAKILNIKIIITFQTLFPNRFFAVNSLEDFENLINQTKHSLNNIKIPKSFKKELFYMNNLKFKKKKCILSLLGDILKLPLDNSKPMSLSGVFQKYLECSTFNNTFYDIALKDIELETPFVYFPMQLQPEMTTSMLGKEYSDQLLALEQLSSFIPDDWVIYAKENPKQQPKQRDEFFFKRIQSIKKVKYISLSYNTHTLIEKSKFVSVIMGTAGWEAISGGKNVLIFGDAWYRGLPGVYNYKDKPNIENLELNEINHDELEIKLNTLMDVAYAGVIDPVYEKIVENYKHNKNVKSLLNFLKDAIKI